MVKADYDDEDDEPPDKYQRYLLVVSNITYHVGQLVSAPAMLVNHVAQLVQSWSKYVTHVGLMFVAYVGLKLVT